MADESSGSAPRPLGPPDSYVVVETDDVIVWRASHRAVVEYRKGGALRIATFWVDEEDGFPQLAFSDYAADDPDLEAHWAKVVSEGTARLETGLRRLRER